MLNVKDAPFGAKGDGVTDDTQAIKSAIEYLTKSEQILPDIDQKAIGGTIYFPPGRYVVSQAIEINKDNITFQGDGTASAIIQYEQSIRPPLSDLGSDRTSDSEKLYVFRVLGNKRTIHFKDLVFAKGGIVFEDDVRHHSSVRRCVFVGTGDYAIC